MARNHLQNSNTIEPTTTAGSDLPLGAPLPVAAARPFSESTPASGNGHLPEALRRPASASDSPADAGLLTPAGEAPHLAPMASPVSDFHTGEGGFGTSLPSPTPDCNAGTGESRNAPVNLVEAAPDAALVLAPAGGDGLGLRQEVPTDDLFAWENEGGSAVEKSSMTDDECPTVDAYSITQERDKSNQNGANTQKLNTGSPIWDTLGVLEEMDKQRAEERAGQALPMAAAAT